MASREDKMTALDSVPLIVFFVGIVLFSALSMEGGFRLGLNRRQSGAHESEAPLGSMIASTLGLLAFLLAITFNIAANRFEDRRTAVLHEANAIGTAYLRTDFLDQPVRDQLKQHFREYVAVRLTAKGTSLRPAISKSELLQKQLWSEAADLAPKYSQSPIYALFIESLNEVIDIHEERIAAGLYGRVPVIVWLSLFIVACLSMTGVGYVCGLTGSRSWPPATILIMTFSIVMFLVADLDRPGEGIIQTGLKPLNDLSNSIGPP
jgi:hypothetical protein